MALFKILTNSPTGSADGQIVSYNSSTNAWEPTEFGTLASGSFSGWDLSGLSPGTFSASVGKLHAIAATATAKFPPAPSDEDELSFCIKSGPGGLTSFVFDGQGVPVTHPFITETSSSRISDVVSSSAAWANVTYKYSTTLGAWFPIHRDDQLVWKTTMGGGGDGAVAGTAFIERSVAIGRDIELEIDNEFVGPDASDTFFYVSGTLDPTGSNDKFSVFGGSVRISGALVVGTGSIVVDDNQIYSTDSPLTFADSANPAGVTLSELNTGLTLTSLTTTDYSASVGDLVFAFTPGKIIAPTSPANGDRFGVLNVEDGGTQPTPLLTVEAVDTNGFIYQGLPKFFMLATKTVTWTYESAVDSWVEDNSNDAGVSLLRESYYVPFGNRYETGDATPTVLVSWSLSDGTLLTDDTKARAVNWTFDLRATEEVTGSVARWKADATFSSGAISGLTPQFINFSLNEKSADLSAIDVKLVLSGTDNVSLVITGSATKNLMWHLNGHVIEQNWK
jgi:hypothetical protein